MEIDITKIIEKFNQNKSAGNDDNGSYIIKEGSKRDSKSSHIYIFNNLSISTGVVPNKLNIAKVIPIYKNQDAEMFLNYHPVSLLPRISKILERLVFDKFYKYLWNP